MILASPLLEIRKQAMEYELYNFRRPTEVTMHPMVWMDLLNSLKPGELGWINYDGDIEIMGMKVKRDRQFPGIQILVS